MAQTHARPGQVVSVRPLGNRLGCFRTTAILKADQLEVVHIVLGAGKQLREHSTPGAITVQCIEGRIAFPTPEASHVLEAGDFIHLRRDELHALEAIVDSSALLTLCIPKPS
jgi:quercetin dioxygenase-like cupin family protein